MNLKIETLKIRIKNVSSITSDFSFILRENAMHIKTHSHIKHLIFVLSLIVFGLLLNHKASASDNWTSRMRSHSLDSEIPLDTIKKKNEKVNTIMDDEHIADVVQSGEIDTQPQFYWGEDSFFNCLVNNKECQFEDDKSKQVNCTIWVSFVVDANGQLKNVRVDNSDSSLLVYEQEAIRLVKLLTKWKPAISKGKPVSILCKLPIEFVNEDD